MSVPAAEGQALNWMASTWFGFALEGSKNRIAGPGAPVGLGPTMAAAFGTLTDREVTIEQVASAGSETENDPDPRCDVHEPGLVDGTH